MSAPLNVLRKNLCRLSQNGKPLKEVLLKNVPAVGARFRRNLHLQEYQSKKLMTDYGVAVQKFVVCDSPEDAKHATDHLKVDEYVIKAQILAGGRGKGTFSNGFKGGVHLTKDPSKVENLVDSMLGNNLITKQTGKNGVKVSKVMVAEALDIARETYFAIVLDRTHAGPVMVGSRHGGMDIEETAEKDPDSIVKVPVDITTGITKEQSISVAQSLGFEGSKLQQAADQISKLYELFVNVDATQVEINPFAETPDGRVVCFDAKINFDDNASFRQSEIFAMDDKAETDPREVEAERLRLNYIGLEGSIGCLVNGAGLAMATMDIIKLHGGEPANFLDIGGGVSQQQVHDAFHLLMGDKHVKAILVNIFGGIVNCGTVATGIVQACKQLHLELPLVVRLQGNNMDKAQEILTSSGLNIKMDNDFSQAAKIAVECAKQNS